MDRAEEVLLGEFHDESRRFFEETWKRPPSSEDYQCRVYLSYPCATMNEIFLQRALKEATGEEKKYLEEVRSSSFIGTQNGMLSQVEELAGYYKRHKKFPRILVVDLLLREGRSLAEYIFSLTDAICEELEIHDDTLEYRMVYIQLFKATELAVFMQSLDDPPLVEIGALGELIAWRQDDTATYFGFWQKMMGSTTFSDVAQNGNFLPTFWVPEDDYEVISQHLQKEGCSHGWRRGVWRKWKRSVTVWQSGPVGQASELRLRRAVRCNYCMDTRMYAVTPFVFWQTMDNRRNEVLYANVAKLLEQSGDTVFSPIVSLLRRNKQYLGPVKLQLVMTISSILVFCQFVSDGNRAEMNFSSLKTDIEKVAGCVGRVKDFAPALTALTRTENKSLRKMLWSAVQNCISVNAEPLCAKDEPDAEHGKACYLLEGEKHLCDADTQMLKTIAYRHKRKISFGPNSAYYNEEDGFLESYLDSFPKDYTSLDKKIGVLLLLLTWVVVELKVRRSYKTGRQEICLQQY